MDKAFRVCATCKTRKKACDKCLPKCGYCNKRNLTCIYYEEEEGGHYPIQTGLLSNSTDPFRSVEKMTAMTVDDLVHDQLRQVISLTGLSIRQMIQEFFQGVYTVFPVISAEPPPWINISVYEREGVLSADVALVVLSMYLLTMRSVDGKEEQRQATTSIEQVYITTKKLLSHVQALRTSSIYLVQASLLMAAFEYACCRPYAAYVSIGACSRLAMVLGRGGDFGPENLCNVLGENVFWGLVSLERLVACEVGIPFIPSLGYYRLPAKVEHTNEHSIVTDGEKKALDLLSRVLLLTKSPDRPEAFETLSLQLQRVSSDLQDFLSASLDSLATKGVASYMVIATAIRSLFCLHRYILDALITTPDKLDRPNSSNSPGINSNTMVIHEVSLNALDTATRIMIDTSHDHVQYGIPHALETFPLCGGYNLRCAMEHLKKYGAARGRGDPSPQRNITIVNNDLARLEELYGAFCRRWKPIIGDG